MRAPPPRATFSNKKLTFSSLSDPSGSHTPPRILERARLSELNAAARILARAAPHHGGQPDHSFGW
jgi:hypothetical protein